MAELGSNTKITVTQKQAHGNCGIVTAGELISTQGDKATVLLEGEAVVREVPISAVQAADDTIGNMSGRMNEQPVINQMPRRYSK